MSLTESSFLSTTDPSHSFFATVPFFHDKSNPLYDFDMFFQDDGARSLRYAPYSANTGQPRAISLMSDVFFSFFIRWNLMSFCLPLSGFYYVRNNVKTKFLFRALLFQGE